LRGFVGKAGENQSLNFTPRRPKMLKMPKAMTKKRNKKAEAIMRNI